MMKAQTAWVQESCTRRFDSDSRAEITQLTSSAGISNNIYGEQPYNSSDGRYIALHRYENTFRMDESSWLLVQDLERLRIRRIHDQVIGTGCHAWSGEIYYWTIKRELMRLNLESQESELIYVQEDPEGPMVSSSVSPDQRYLIGLGKRLKGEGAPVFQIIRFDTKRQEMDVIFEHPEICNPHLQYSLDGTRILVQNNRGLRMDAEGVVDWRSTEEGTTLFSINADGGDQQMLPAGPPHTASITGHECFIGNTGNVLFSTSWNRKDWSFDKRYPTGNLFISKPGREKPECLDIPDHRFNHVSMSRCGRYFVADSRGDSGLFQNDELSPVALVMGSVETGKYRTLVADTQSSGGGNQCSHTHPYITADNKRVIYNSDPYYSVPNLFSATIPEEFLKSLN